MQITVTPKVVNEINRIRNRIRDTGSRDPWKLARSQAAPKELKDYLAMYDAAVIIMHKPSLITG